MGGGSAIASARRNGCPGWLSGRRSPHLGVLLRWPAASPPEIFEFLRKIKLVLIRFKFLTFFLAASSAQTRIFLETCPATG